MYLGVDYYPEHWDENMIDEDLDNIIELGSNVIRIGEFAWHMMENVEGNYDFSYFDRVIKKAKEKNILLEVNNSSLSPNTSREGARENILKYLELCKEYGVRIIMGTDSHICYDIGVFQYAEPIIEEANFPKELVINYWEDRIIEFFGI